MSGQYEWSYPKIILVDFDETITDRQAYDPDPPKVQKHCIKTLQNLRRLGFKIVIYSCRNNTEIHDQAAKFQEMAEFLDNHNVPYDSIETSKKPLNCFIIDDRAVHHNGNWLETSSAILARATKDELI